jgi:hypothetical protein
MLMLMLMLIPIQIFKNLLVLINKDKYKDKQELIIKIEQVYQEFSMRSLRNLLII